MKTILLLSFTLISYFSFCQTPFVGTINTGKNIAVYYYPDDQSGKGPLKVKWSNEENVVISTTATCGKLFVDWDIDGFAKKMGTVCKCSDGNKFALTITLYKKNTIRDAYGVIDISYHNELGDTYWYAERLKKED